MQLLHLVLADQTALADDQLDSSLPTLLHTECPIISSLGQVIFAQQYHFTTAFHIHLLLIVQPGSLSNMRLSDLMSKGK